MFSQEFQSFLDGIAKPIRSIRIFLADSKRDGPVIGKEN